MNFFNEKKKLKMAVAGIIVVVITSYIPEVDEAALTKIVALIIAYIFGQGLADFSKETKK